MERQLLETNEAVSRQIRSLRREMAAEFGWLSRAATRLIGPLALMAARREERRLSRGKTYEPHVIIERRNWA